MVFKTVAVVLGQSDVVSKKGNKYQEVLLQQGTETLKMLARDVDMAHVEPYKEYIIEVNYSTGYKEFKCLSIQQKPGLPNEHKPEESKKVS